MFGKQDPFIRFKYAGVEYDTKIIEGGGKNPIWDE